MERELSRFFKRLKKEVLNALHEYWSEYHLLQGQINLMVAPVHEAHKEYYEILEKYVRKEYKAGVAEAKRNVNRLERKNRVALKAATPMPIKGFIKRDNELFATDPKAEKDLLNRTFKASENTMARVDKQINNIITEGYRSGKGINDIGNQLTKRFDQLASWEARRIARTEVNTSHNTATFDTYQELGMEYTQWIAASDDRTRDSHVEVDGEIIPIGATYSNGLRFPGDMSGPIEEWINCRCSNAPFIIPYGYMAPSFSPFREEDLVPVETRDFQDFTNQANEELQTNVPHSPFGPMDKFRLTPDEWARYTELKFQEDNGGLKFKQKREYKKLEIQLELDKWHKKLVKEGKLDGYDAEAYYKKYYNDNYIQEKFNLTKLEDTSKLQGKTPKNIQKLIDTYGKEDRFELTAEEWKRYNELKPKADELLFMERMEYEDLVEQIRLDELHKKLLDKGKLNETEAKGYASLYGSITMREKFDTSLIEDTNLLQGKKPVQPTVPKTPTKPTEPEIPYAPKTKTINDKTYTNFTDDTSVIMDKQIKQQKNNGYTKRDIEVVHNWGMEGHKDISAICFNVPELKTGLKTDMEIRQDIQDLESAINKGKGFEEPTTIFRGGEIPEGLKEGDIFEVDGFQSYSFDEDVARDFKEENEDRFLITSHGDKGTKGVHIDDEMFAGLSEDEWLTQIHQKHRVIKVDYEKQTLETEFINDW